MSKKKKGNKMATFIDEGFCKEDDPIFTEGITAFSRRSQKSAPRKKTLEEVGHNAGSAVTPQAEDEREPND